MSGTSGKERRHGCDVPHARRLRCRASQPDPRAIEGAATATTSFIGYTRRGFATEAVRTSWWGEYVDRFGGVGLTGERHGINDFLDGHHVGLSAVGKQ